MTRRLSDVTSGYSTLSCARSIRARSCSRPALSERRTPTGPSRTGGYGNLEVLPAADLAAYTGDADAFSYHHYGAVSQRCAAMGHQTSADQALSEDWLGRTDQTLAYYRGVRDKFMPGKPFWNTETADAACGGNPWGGTFLDTFRYLDQLGRLARQEVNVVIHNTLVASDYGLLDENTFEPRPNFWGALLWRRNMGTTVLDPGPSTTRACTSMPIACAARRAEWRCWSSTPILRTAGPYRCRSRRTDTR